MSRHAHETGIKAGTLCLSLLLAASSAQAGEAPSKPQGKQPAEKWEFEQFQLVLLVRAPTWKKLPDAEAEKLQAAHIGHLTKMGEAGKAVVCGPFDDQKDITLRGACIYRVGSADEARKLAEEDPTVKVGQLRIEAVTWYVGKGHMTFPKAPPDKPEAPKPTAPTPAK